MPEVVDEYYDEKDVTGIALFEFEFRPATVTVAVVEIAELEKILDAFTPDVVPLEVVVDEDGYRHNSGSTTGGEEGFGACSRGVISTLGDGNAGVPAHKLLALASRLLELLGLAGLFMVGFGLLSDSQSVTLASG